MVVYSVYGDTIQAKVVVMCLTHFHILPSDVWFQYRAPIFTVSHPMFDFSTAQPADTTPPPPLAWCRNIYSIPTHNSAQIIVSVFCILTFYI